VGKQPSFDALVLSVARFFDVSSRLVGLLHPARPLMDERNGDSRLPGSIRSKLYYRPSPSSRKLDRRREENWQWAGTPHHDGRPHNRRHYLETTVKGTSSALSGTCTCFCARKKIHHRFSSSAVHVDLHSSPLACVALDLLPLWHDRVDRQEESAIVAQEEEGR
jgi:hypothetical protein